MSKQTSYGTSTPFEVREKVLEAIGNGPAARAGDVTDLLYIAINKNGMDLEANYTGPNLVYVLGELEVLKARLIATAVQVRGGAAL